MFTALTAERRRSVLQVRLSDQFASQLSSASLSLLCEPSLGLDALLYVTGGGASGRKAAGDGVSRGTSLSSRAAALTLVATRSSRLLRPRYRRLTVVVELSGLSRSSAGTLPRP